MNQYRLIFHAASATATQWRSWAGTKVATLHCESWTRSWTFAFYQIWGVEQHEPAATNNICIKEPTSSENRSTTTSKVILLRASTFIKWLNKKATNCREQHSISASDQPKYHLRSQNIVHSYQPIASVSQRKWGLINPAISRNPTLSLPPKIFFSFSSQIMTFLFSGS